MSGLETTAVANRASSSFEDVVMVNVYVYDQPIFNNTDLVDCYVKTTGLSLFSCSQGCRGECRRDVAS